MLRHGARQQNPWAHLPLYHSSRAVHSTVFFDGEMPSAERPALISAAIDVPFVSLNLSTSLYCARFSEETALPLRYQPQGLVDTLLVELVHLSEASRLEKLCVGLIEAVRVRSTSIPGRRVGDINSLSPAPLIAPPLLARVFCKQRIRLHLWSGFFDVFSVRLHRGGGDWRRSLPRGLPILSPLWPATMQRIPIGHGMAAAVGTRCSPQQSSTQTILR